MLYLYTQFKVKGYKGYRLQIFTNSMILMDIVFKDRAGLFQVNNLVEDEDWYNFFKDPFIKVSYVDR